uniref:Uncharacterized protein n=1 Tax=viral metagenome TaxID=1070528 RepID=A0A6C0BE98_9ZZZZ
MDLVEEKEMSLEAGDATLLRNLPSKNNALKNGVIASICLCDGKSTKFLFAYMLSHPSITLCFGPDGLKIIETSIDKIKGTIEFITCLDFEINKQLEYCFCPQNIDNDLDKSCVCLTVSSAALNSCVSCSKVGTSLRIEYNKSRRGDIITSITTNGIIVPKYIPIVISKPPQLQISGDITNDKFEANVKIVSEIFSSNMIINSKKTNGVNSGTIINIYNEGMEIQSKAPGTLPSLFGDKSGEPTIFHFDVKTTARLAKLVKISSKSAIFISADKNIMKLTMPVSTYATMKIYQYSDLQEPQNIQINSQFKTYQGVSQEELSKFYQYQNQITSYYDNMIKSGSITQEDANMYKNSYLSQCWNFILSQSQQRMNGNFENSQITQKSKNSVKNSTNNDFNGQLYTGNAISQINSIRSNQQIQNNQNLGAITQQNPVLNEVPKISIVNFEPSSVTHVSNLK